MEPVVISGFENEVGDSTSGFEDGVGDGIGESSYGSRRAGMALSSVLSLSTVSSSLAVVSRWGRVFPLAVSVLN